jgi:Protein of unknown function (DUF3277)
MAAYSFTNVQASISGPGGSASVGYGAGAAEEGISSAMEGDKVGTVAGADGQLMHSLHASNVGTITVRLLKTSPVNATLDAMYNFQRSSAANTGQNTLRVTDVQRGDVLNGSQMAFVKRPDLTWAMDGGTNEWVFRGNVIESLGAGIPDVNI